MTAQLAQRTSATCVALCSAQVAQPLDGAKYAGVRVAYARVRIPPAP